MTLHIAVGSDRTRMALAIYAIDETTRRRCRANAEQGLDGTSQTAGIEVSSMLLPGYPVGLMIARTGVTTGPTTSSMFPGQILPSSPGCIRLNKQDFPA